MSDVAANVPELDRQFERLWRHFFLVSLFIGDSTVDGLARDYRYMLIYLVTKASRHYRKARDIVLGSHGLLPDRTGEQPNLLILEFPFEFEDCINSISRSVDMVKALAAENAIPQSDREKFSEGTTYSKFREIRNVIEHPIARLVRNRQDGQPLRLCPSDDCSEIRLGNHRVTFADAVEVLHDLFDVLTSLIPSFKVDDGSSDAPPGPLHLVATFEAKVIERDT